MAATYFRSDIWVRNAQGQAVAGAQCFICTQPADTSYYPPLPLASVYSDNQGLITLSQPFLTDGLGHAYYYALSGTYTEVIAFGGQINQVFPDQSLGAVIASGLFILNNPVTNPNFSDTTPAAPVGYTNVLWQFSGNQVSAFVPINGGGTEIEINGTLVVGTPNFNAVTPAAPGGKTNITWQIDGSGNISASYTPYVSTVASGTSVFPMNIPTLGGGGLNTFDAWNFTVFARVPSTALTSFPATHRVSITIIVNADGTLGKLSDFNIARTLSGSKTVIDHTPVTWGGTSSPALGIGTFASDVINLQIDAQHDYYFLWFNDFISNNDVLYQSLTDYTLSLVEGGRGPSSGGTGPNGITDYTNCSIIPDGATMALPGYFPLTSWLAA